MMSSFAGIYLDSTSCPHTKTEDGKKVFREFIIRMMKELSDPRTKQMGLAVGNYQTTQIAKGMCTDPDVFFSKHSVRGVMNHISDNTRIVLMATDWTKEPPTIYDIQPFTEMDWIAVGFGTINNDGHIKNRMKLNEFYPTITENLRLLPLGLSLATTGSTTGRTEETINKAVKVIPNFTGNFSAFCVREGGFSDPILIRRDKGVAYADDWKENKAFFFSDEAKSLSQAREVLRDRRGKEQKEMPKDTIFHLSSWGAVSSGIKMREFKIR